MHYSADLKGEYVRVQAITFEIGREGRSWRSDKFEKAYFAMPEKLENIDGKVYWSDEQLFKVLRALLGNVGIDRALRLCDSRLWVPAFQALDT